MELDPRKNKALRTTLILAAVAVAAYFAYQWWQNRGASAAAGGGVTLGTNLNSVMPDLSAGATGPESGIQTPGTSETVNINVPSTGASQQPPAPKPPQKPIPKVMDVIPFNHRKVKPPPKGTMPPTGVEHPPIMGNVNEPKKKAA